MRQLLFLTGCFLTIFNIVNADVFSQKLSDRSEQISRNEFLAEIETHYAECVNEYTEDKIYINSSAIRSTSEGIFLQNKGVSLPIPALFSDARGPYIPASGEADLMSLVRCIGCGKVRFSGEACKNPECPLYKG